jgi:hypothetical protein
MKTEMQRQKEMSNSSQEVFAATNKIGRSCFSFKQKRKMSSKHQGKRIPRSSNREEGNNEARRGKKEMQGIFQPFISDFSDCTFPK